MGESSRSADFTDIFAWISDLEENFTAAFADLPWVPEVIFFRKIEREIRGGAASARREAADLSQSREKNNLWHPGYC